jgi:hypothetical protein
VVARRDRRDQLLLAGEIAVERAGRESRLGDDVLHRGAVEALAREAAQRRGDDLVAAPVQVGAAHPRHRVETTW